jgi:hypothetical protein
MSIRGATIDGVFAPTAGPSNNREAATANAAFQDATKDIWRIGEPGPKQSGFLSCIAVGTEDKRGACLNAREQFITNDSLFGSFDTDPSGFGLASVNAFAGLRIPNLVRPPVNHDTAITLVLQDVANTTWSPRLLSPWAWPWRFDMISIQLLRHGLYRKPVSVKIEYFLDDLRLPFIDTQLRARDKRPPILIAPQGSSIGTLR